MPSSQGFERLQVWIPIPALGHVNSYLFHGEDPSIIDPGMLSGRSILDLTRSLAKRGYKLPDIGRVVLTHFHVDHATGSAILGLEGAEIYAGWRDAWYLNREFKEYVEAAIVLFRQHGAPKSEVELMVKSHPGMRLGYAYEALRELGVKPLREGDHVRLGQWSLRVVETPGHTPGSIILVDDNETIAFVGDTILPGITPHVTLHDPDSDPLGDYLSSLRQIADMKLRIAYPGHRDPITNPAGRALELIRHHEERLQEILEVLKREGPLIAYEVAERVRWRVRYSSWEDYPPAERFFALGETLAHLRRLEVEGLAERVMRMDAYYWRPAGV